jgi:hypothetical protein
MRKLWGKYGVVFSAAIAGVMLSVGAASAATCSAGSGDYSLSGSTTIGANLYCAYNAANNAATDSWTAAESFAVSIGGTLASIDNSTTTADLSTLVAALNNPYPNDFGETPAGPLAWIGLSTYNVNTNFGFYQVQSSDFYWINGDTNTFWQTSSNWVGGVVGQTGQQNGCSTTGSCQELYSFLNNAGSLASWNAITYDNPSLNIGAVVELAGVVTPLPAALPLFATGLGALGVLGWRRKRKDAAAIAA